MKYSLKCIVPLFALAAALALAGCGNGDNNNSNTRNATVTPFIAANDVQYIDAIVPHHRHALEMADMELGKGTRADVKVLAQRIKDAQTAEIALLTSARQALTGSATVPTPPTDPHMESDMQMMEQMAAGAQVDQHFLENMIPHHAEGISIAHRALPNLTRQDMKDNANKVITEQAKEIGEMQALRP
jgi:uncharacterized protein (DUF305 family)